MHAKIAKYITKSLNNSLYKDSGNKISHKDGVSIAKDISDIFRNYIYISITILFIFSSISGFFIIKIYIFESNISIPFGDLLAISSQVGLISALINAFFALIVATTSYYSARVVLKFQNADAFEGVSPILKYIIISSPSISLVLMTIIFDDLYMPLLISVIYIIYICVVQPDNDITSFRNLMIALITVNSCAFYLICIFLPQINEAKVLNYIHKIDLFIFITPVLCTFFIYIIRTAIINNNRQSLLMSIIFLIVFSSFIIWLVTTSSTGIISAGYASKIPHAIWLSDNKMGIILHNNASIGVTDHDANTPRQISPICIAFQTSTITYIREATEHEEGFSCNNKEQTKKTTKSLGSSRDPG
jgi:hypothetical protein